MILIVAALALLTTGQDTTRYTHADTLRGSNGPARAWWDAQFYDLHVALSLRDSSISGWNRITYRVLQAAGGGGREMQIDLQPPLVIDSVVQERRKLAFRRDGKAFFVTLNAAARPGSAGGGARSPSGTMANHASGHGSPGMVDSHSSGTAWDAPGSPRPMKAWAPACGGP